MWEADPCSCITSDLPPAKRRRISAPVLCCDPACLRKPCCPDECDGVDTNVHCPDECDGVDTNVHCPDDCFDVCTDLCFDPCPDDCADPCILDCPESCVEKCTEYCLDAFDDTGSHYCQSTDCNIPYTDYGCTNFLPTSCGSLAKTDWKDITPSTFDTFDRPTCGLEQRHAHDTKCTLHKISTHSSVHGSMASTPSLSQEKQVMSASRRLNIHDTCINTSNSESLQEPTLHVCAWLQCTAQPFSSAQALHDHVKEQHSKKGPKGFVCMWQGCNTQSPDGSLLPLYAAGTKNHFHRHMQRHTGFAPHSCPECARTFKTPQQLNNHLKTHTGEKQYKCKYCDKSFALLDPLRIHERIHTKELRFECPVCGDKGPDSSNMSAHKRDVHGDAGIPCPDALCTYRDSRTERLKSHMRECNHGTEFLADLSSWSEYCRIHKSSRKRRANEASRTPSVACSGSSSRASSSVRVTSGLEGHWALGLGMAWIDT